MTFQKAVKREAKLRMALIGPSGSGKTYSALRIAAALGNKIALVDTEHGSASKYADLFAFDVLELESFAPANYIEAIHEAERAGYDVLILDSLSHAWAGKDGILQFVDEETAKSRSKNAFSEGWRKASPIHANLIDAMLASKLHLIATMRTKTEYIVEKDEKGRSAPRKVGLQPVQRDGMEYEFDVIGDLDLDNTMVVNKSRCPALTGKMFDKPGEDVAAILAEWLTGEKKTAEPKPKQAKPANGDGKRPADPVTMRHWLRKRAGWTEGETDDWSDAKRQPDDEQIPPEQRDVQRLAAVIGDALKADGRPEADVNLLRHGAYRYLYRQDSGKSLTAHEVQSALAAWEADPGAWTCNGYAVQEIAAIVAEALKEAGQQELPLAE